MSKKPCSKGSKRVKKIIGIIAICLAAILVFYFGFMLIYHATYTVTVPDKIVNSSAYVTANGKGLYDAEGNKLQIRGTNAGNWLVFEGWLGVTSLGATKNGYKYEYGEVSMSEVILALQNNQNLSEDDEYVVKLRQLLSFDSAKYWWYEEDCSTTDLLLDWYYSNWWTEEDFDNVKALGLNTIRLPFYYRTVMTGDDDNLVMKKNAFKWLDWFISNCAERELYCILDCHGAVGSQNGYEHSGKLGTAELWTNETYISETEYMWSEIAKHYKYEQAEIGRWIAAYDLLNEPRGTTSSTDWTTREEWDVLSRLYNAVRAVDSEHCISIGACWSFENSPNPDDYGFTNVLYQQHWYNWFTSWLTFDAFFLYQDMTLPLHDYDVPILIGEFNFFDDRDTWVDGLKYFEKRNYGWTTWTYKSAVVGNWDTSWALYTLKMNQNEQTDCKIDIRSATALDIISAWGAVATTSAGINEDWFSLVNRDAYPYSCNPTNEKGYEKTYDFLDDYIAENP